MDHISQSVAITPGPIGVKPLISSFTNVRNKQVFVLDRPFQPSLMSASKARAYPSEMPIRFSILWLASCITHKHFIKLERPNSDKHLTKICKKVLKQWTKLENLASDKHPSLLGPFINY